MAEYHVGIGRQYESFTECLLNMEPGTANTIYIHEGTYDIFREYRDAKVPRTPKDLADVNDYMPYNVIVPADTHIIGIGHVVLNYMPGADETYATESHVVSPLNVSGSATIENLEIHCKNGRYCIHDETLGLPEYAGAQKKYINVRTYKHNNDPGLGHVSGIGFGFDNFMGFTFLNCEFYNEINVPFYMHNRSKSTAGYVYPVGESSHITLEGCIIDARSPENDAIFLGNCSSDMHNTVTINDCRIRGYILAADERDRTFGTKPNAYEFILNRTSDVDIIIADPQNKYPPTVCESGPRWLADNAASQDEVIAE